MKKFDIKWETHHKKAGGIGQIEASDAEDAKKRTREALADTTKLTKDELEKLVIEVTEVV